MTVLWELQGTALMLLATDYEPTVWVVDIAPVTCYSWV